MSIVDGADSARASIARWAMSSPRRNRQDALRAMRDDALALLGTGTGGWSDRDIQDYADEINRHLYGRAGPVRAYRRRVLDRLGPQLARDAAALTGPADDPADAEQQTAMCTTRRPDGQPETPADTRFFDLRESGYADPIDQDGHPVTATSGQGQPTTDAEFLDSCDRLASQLSDLAVEVTDWAEGLADLHLPRPVVAPLHDAGRLLAGAALQVIQASQTFRAQFSSARQAAARGLRITGDSS